MPENGIQNAICQSLGLIGMSFEESALRLGLGMTAMTRILVQESQRIYSLQHAVIYADADSKSIHKFNTTTFVGQCN